MNSSKAKRLLQSAGTYLKENKPAKADTVCNQLLKELSPGHEVHGAALHLKGMCCANLNKLEEGIGFLEQAVKSAPEKGQFYFSLATLHFKNQQDQKGIAVIEACLDRVKVDGIELEQIADLLMTYQQKATAVRYYEESLERNPRRATALYSLGCAYNDLESPVKAVDCFEKALSLGLTKAEVYHNLGQACYQLGEVNRAYDLFTRAYRMKKDRVSATSVATVVPGASKASPGDILKWRKVVNELVPEFPVRKPSSPRRSSGKPRIGYLSSFFDGENWMKPVWGLVNEHDREQFDVHILSLEKKPPFLGYHAHPADHLHVYEGRNLVEIVDSIRALDLDLLIELNAYSKVFPLPLNNAGLARVVAGWFNWFATSGFDGVDYLIGDSVVISESEEAIFSEKILRVPGSYITFRVLYDVPEVVAPPCSLKEGAPFTFGSFCSLYKITPEMIDSWSRILSQCPSSRLLIRNGGLDDEPEKEWLRSKFSSRGITPDRLMLKGRADHYEFLKTYNEIDVALDTFPYNGGTTTTEAIWQGVPVLAFIGDRWVARTSASLLLAGGLDEFVANDLEGMEQLAVKLATDPATSDYLKKLRFSMREKLLNSPVCDSRGLARSMEALYRQMMDNAPIQGA